ncbi:MAG: phosphoenolpyruvate mutase [Spirochaetales bacterium]|nr:phosphoenolpyruvate mutase [Spirochaetales bacterium]
MEKTNPHKSKLLRDLLYRPEIGFLMEAHNGLSARIAEEAGFEAIWASGLSISAALGVRDSNEASWTQVLEVLEFMCDASRIPILLDGDTGYGNFNTMRRVVRKLESRGVAGVCIEDKIFPKTNSFIKGTTQPLADSQEFAGKIKAGKDAQSDADFCIVARVEAFIAGWGLDEALRRAETYHAAGADAILIHSALANPSEILSFKKEWGNRLPVIIVPTKYYTTPTDVFVEQGFAAVIWANHLMRSALKAMQDTARQIFQEKTLINVEDNIVSVAEVFRIQGEDELAEAEKLYLPAGTGNFRSIILAASRGQELGELTVSRPKCMVDIKGRPLLAHIADSLRSIGIKDLVCVRGYGKESVNLTSIRYFDNDDFESTQEVFSLYTARSCLSGNVIVCYGDVLFKKYIPQELADLEADFAVAVDADWQTSRNRNRVADYITASEPNSRSAFYHPVYLKKIPAEEGHGIHGEWMGFLRLSDRGCQTVKEILEEMSSEELRRSKIPDLLCRLLSRGEHIRLVYSTGHWLDVDSVDDVLAASRF